ncbi:MAG: PepSY domain-containing protein [Roseiflexus sp.]
MKQHTLLGIAAALTAFILVVIGALAGQVSQTGIPAATDTVVVPTETPVSAPVALDPTVEALIREREAAYQRALEEANRQLAEANQRIETANRQIAQQTAQQQSAPAAQNSAPTQPTYPVPPEQAQAIALSLANGATLTKPAELVLYQGTPAYEVIFDRGAVYIDAQSGAVIANTLAQPQPQSVAQMGITSDQAAQIAIAYRGEGQIKKVEFERERGVDVYEVKFTDGAKVYVAASDGAVVYARLDKAQNNDDKRNDKDDDD